MTHVTQRTATLTTWAVAALCAFGSITLAAPVEGASPPPEVHEVYPVPASGSFSVSGHGYGHGHGLSQWGAYGAAKVSNLSSNQILHFYYPHTTLDTKSVSQTVRVLLTAAAAPSRGYVEFDPAPGLAVTPAPSAASATKAKKQDASDTQVLPETADGGATIDHWRLRKSGGTVALQAHWSGAWHVQTADVGPAATVSDTADLIAVVEPNGSANKTIRYRGQIVGGLVSGSMQAVNNVLVESYIQAVVPSEMSSSWPAAALQSQAVAARTYTWRGIGSPKAAWYDLDGDTRDQAYGGYGSETKKTNNAIHATAGEVAVDSTGTPIFAQYSAADGGWTAAGSQPYLPAKRDPYDGAVPNNAHTWTSTLTAKAIEAAYPSIGNLQQLVITGRDGHGTWGGRVTTLSVVGSSGTATPAGSAFQSAFGLRSAWFRPTPAPDAPKSLVAKVIGHTVTLTWQAPDADRATQITGYKVTLTPGGRTTSVDASTLSATFTAVAAGTYTAKVVAKSAVGASPPASVAVTVKKLL